MVACPGAALTIGLQFRLPGNCKLGHVALAVSAAWVGVTLGSLLVASFLTDLANANRTYWPVLFMLLLRSCTFLNPKLSPSAHPRWIFSPQTPYPLILNLQARIR